MANVFRQHNSLSFGQRKVKNLSDSQIKRYNSSRDDISHVYNDPQLVDWTMICVIVWLCD